jgi:hypothetical protein
MLREALIAALVVMPLPALAWGAEGHEIAAAIALQELAPATRGQVAALLGSAAMMVHDSNWADEIRDQRPWTGDWHFVDVPLDASGYDPARDCPADNCVVAQIGDDLKLLRDRNAPKAARAEALRFLIHFVADIHQPLHTVDNGDKGGNAVRVTLGRLRSNMHHVWDTVLVEQLGADTAAIAGAIEHGLTPAQKKAWQSGTPASWANESHQIARDEVYALTDGRDYLRLPRGYPDAEAPVVKMQLAKAGLRLAWLLNGALR